MCALVFRILLCHLILMPLLLAGCAAPDGPEPEDASPDEQDGEAFAPLTVDDKRVRAADGSVLLCLSDIPDAIRVDEDSEFGAATRFREASASPGGGWLAIVTTGAAHSAGWLVRTGERDVAPVAFQYGGSITVGPWSDDGRHMVFIQKGPAGGAR